jgi:hypothetical protein
MCKVSWCHTPLEESAHWASKYCAVHKQYKQYGKNAPRRPWLFYKTEKIVEGNFTCEKCGYSPIRYYPDRPLKELSGLFDVDHINSEIKHTEKGEHPDNYQLVCKHCHVLKSYDERDYTRKDYR